MEQGNLESWDGFLGSNFLNSTDVNNEDHKFVCVGTEFDQENSRPILILESSGVKAKFSLNVTNSNFVKNSGITSPKDAIGKTLIHAIEVQSGAIVTADGRSKAVAGAITNKITDIDGNSEIRIS